MRRAILYIRVSTDEQADKGYSQRNQDEVLRRFCALKDWQVDETVFEDHSAKTFNRPAWKTMLEKLKRSKKKHDVNYILFTKWDRFSRNTADAYQMIGILRDLGIEPQAIEQPLDLTVPENKMMLAFYLAVPEVENDRRALNIFHGMRRAKKEGRWISSAPTGYINRTTEDGRKYIRPIEPQATIMQNAFRQIATGKYATDQVWKMAREKGLRCGRMNFWNLIRNPIYCGKIVVSSYKDEEMQLANGQHAALITEDLFYKVQSVLTRRKVKRGTKTTSLCMMPLRGFLKCPNCERKLTGSASKGRSDTYHYYHCGKGCSARFKVEAVNSAFEKKLTELIPSSAFTALYREIVRDVFRMQMAGSKQKRTQSLSQLDGLYSRLEKARELLLTGGIGVEDYQIIKTECEQKISVLKEQLNNLPDIDETVTKLLNRCKIKSLSPYSLYLAGDLETKRTMITKLLAEDCMYKNNDLQNVAWSKAVKLIYNV